MKKTISAIVAVALLASLCLTGCGCKHEIVIDQRIEPTCTEDGLTEGSHCSKCDEVLEEQTVIPARGHTEETVEAKEATICESGNTAGIRCSVCGKALEGLKIIPAWDSGIVGRIAQYIVDNGEQTGSLYTMRPDEDLDDCNYLLGVTFNEDTEWLPAIQCTKITYSMGSDIAYNLNVTPVGVSMDYLELDSWTKDEYSVEVFISPEFFTGQLKDNVVSRGRDEWPWQDGISWGEIKGKSHTFIPVKEWLTNCAIATNDIFEVLVKPSGEPDAFAVAKALGFENYVGPDAP